MYALTERRSALKPFRSHGVLHWSLNYCLTWPDSIKNNVHEPYQDQGEGWDPVKPVKAPSNVITNRSKAVLLVRLILNKPRSVYRTLTIVYIKYFLIVELLGTSLKRYNTKSCRYQS